jgi:hypothetical protein
MFRSAVLTLLLAGAVTPVMAQRAGNPLASAKAFSCSFPVYTVARWENGEPVLRTGNDNFTFRIEDIDLNRRRARFVATGSVPVTATLTSTSVNFIEQTPDGNFILTTIFASTVSADTHYAVHARHLGDPAGAPSASQFHGTCTAD